MVDIDRLQNLLPRIVGRLRVLDEYAAVDDVETLLEDRVRMNDLKYTFQTTIEACIDAAHHVVASDGLGAPETNGDAFRLLGKADLLDPPLVESMVGATGFRNVLVYGYADVRDDLVVDNLSRRDEFRSFVSAMSGLLAD